VALRHGNLSIVLPIAFCLTPVIGAILGIIFLKEPIHIMQIVGITLTVAGATLVVYYRAH
ncbi:MAG TPA: EamA family transporter, partial [Alphaproteobacteria bacterium]|nr:EamA family transporter [Alphaproteobacteria bacterium]